MTGKRDTIVAVASGTGGAIALIRLSGPRAIAIGDRIFTGVSGSPLSRSRGFTIHFGHIRNEADEIIDDVLVSLFRTPRSYTGEDMLEISCHGSPFIQQEILRLCIREGARMAQGGEFTLKAFLAGKMDLSQAEAVADLLEAETPQAVRTAAGQLTGALSRRVEEVYSGLVDLLAHFHAVLDYPDEDIDPFRASELAAALAAATDGLSALLETYDRGKYLVQGVPCAIVGAPNAGKSSLLNALLGYERAIVTPIPGTTRDTVEETVRLGGVLLRLIDTAGLRKTEDPVERLGVERSRRAMEKAGLILVVLDQSQPATEEDKDLVRQAVDLAPTILVLNKADLPRGLDFTEDLDLAPATPVSAKTRAGLEDLGELVAGTFPQPAAGEAGAVLTNARQADAVRRAAEALGRARAGLAAGLTPDAVLIDVEEAMEAMGELTGRTVREDITNRIFERFCVGK